ncbi:MAG: hypothetical protein MUF04_07355 [Akkermansiaceae bacterium]|jgi:hypothetical protein|nr:hypothetical protein [Akkermansiaceae bacterium]
MFITRLTISLATAALIALPAAAAPSLEPGAPIPEFAGKRAWLEIHPHWRNGAAFAPDRVVSLTEIGADFGGEDRLFTGGAGGVAFGGFQLVKLTPADLAKLPVTDAFPNDLTARTWLPVKGISDQTADADLSELLKPLSAAMRPLVCWYAGSSLQAGRTLLGGKLELPGSRWDLAVDAKPVAGREDARDLTLSFTLREGAAPAAGVAAAFDFSHWSTDNYVLIPAAVYHGNRLRTVARGYNAGLEASDYYRKDLSLTQTEVPRLEIEPGKPSKLEVNASNVTTPAICIFDRKAKRGFILLAEQGGRAGSGDFIRKPDGEVLDSAFAVEESADRSRATVVVSAPGVRERKPEFIGFSSSPDRGIALKAGDSIQIKLRVYSFAAADIPALLERFMTVRKDLTGPNHPRKLVPASQVESWMTQRIDSRHLQQPDAAFYCPENGPWLAFGWIGGWINTAPMLTLGDDTHLERVSHTFDYGLKAQQPSGWFSYAIRNDGNTEFRDPGRNMNLARTSGDILFWMLKQFQLLKAQGRGQAVKPEWESSMKRLADAMVTTWKRDGQWGKLINYKSGAVAEYNTTGGAMIIGGLALASGYFDHPAYLEVAKEAADFYYERDLVQQGFTTGGCADILQNADSETAAGFMTALMALYEATGETRWLEMARNLANLTATWTVSHDYELPKSTELGGLGAKLTGVVWASTQNKHGAPGICTSSGDPLFKIYRATGDARYAELMRDIVAAHGESIRPGGFTNERLTFCDADSRGSRGGHVTGWNETNGILMAQEIPGIYLRTDIDRTYVFDAVEAKVLKRAGGAVTLELTNPTPHDARVAIFAENAGQAAKPQGYTAFLTWPKVPVKAGGTARVGVKPDGSVAPD